MTSSRCVGGLVSKPYNQSSLGTLHVPFQLKHCSLPTAGDYWGTQLWLV